MFPRKAARLLPISGFLSVAPAFCSWQVAVTNPDREETSGHPSIPWAVAGMEGAGQPLQASQLLKQEKKLQ